MAMLKMSAPWNVFYYEMQEMFRNDPQVHIVYDEAEHIINLYVDDEVKASALDRLLPKEKIFGNITLMINVYISNVNPERPAMTVTPYEYTGSVKKVFDDAFNGNGAFSFTKTCYGICNIPICYVIFTNKVVQYFNDDISDYYGQCSTLYQIIAADIFNEIEGVYYCTDKPKNTLLNDLLIPGI